MVAIAYPVVGDKEHSLGKRYAVADEEHHTVHTLGKAVLVNGKRDLALGRRVALVKECLAAVEHGTAYLGLQLEVVLHVYGDDALRVVDLKDCSLVLHLGQVEPFLLLAVNEHGCVVGAVLGGECECAHTHVLGLYGKQLLAVGKQGNATLAVDAVGTEHLECHTALQFLYKVASLGVELEVAFGQL